MEDFEKLSDGELYGKCKLYGGDARLWSKKFAALLPEVEKRQLYKKYGFYSIFEFSAKLAGMSRETVLDILRVAKKLEDKPLLKNQIETQGWNKLRVVATIATQENEKMLAEKVRKMSKPTLETWVHEIRKQNQESVQFRPRTEFDQNLFGTSPSGKLESDISNTTLNYENYVHLRIPLKFKTELRLRELQKKLSKERKAPMNLNEVLEVLMDNYEKLNGGRNNSHSFSIPNAANEIKTVAQLRTLKNEVKKHLAEKPPSRYIPSEVKKVLYIQYGGRCAYRNCRKLPEIFHHARRFSINSSHDPDYLAPLCKNHERLAHHGLMGNEEKPPGEWYIKSEPDKSSPKYWIDQKVQQYRAPP